MPVESKFFHSVFMFSLSIHVLQDVGYDKLTFFEHQNKFWAPASTTSGLYEQLAVNKYREIPREKIE